MQKLHFSQQQCVQFNLPFTLNTNTQGILSNLPIQLWWPRQSVKGTWSDVFHNIMMTSLFAVTLLSGTELFGHQDQVRVTTPLHLGLPRLASCPPHDWSSLTTSPLSHRAATTHQPPATPFSPVQTVRTPCTANRLSVFSPQPITVQELSSPPIRERDEAYCTGSQQQ